MSFQLARIHPPLLLSSDPGAGSNLKRHSAVSRQYSIDFLESPEARAGRRARKEVSVLKLLQDGIAGSDGIDLRGKRIGSRHCGVHVQGFLFSQLASGCFRRLKGTEKFKLTASG